MIFLISTFDEERLDFLPQFVAHYRRFGVETFLITFHRDPRKNAETNRGAQARFESILGDLGIDESFAFDGVFDTGAFYEHKDRLQAERVGTDDWIVWADSDEFQLYPARLPHFLAEMESNGINLVRGTLLDRIAADLSLASFDPARPIWEQYPLACLVTRDLAKGETRKVACARGWIQVAHGHHVAAIRRPGAAPPLRMPGASYPAIKALDHYVLVHHFKWDAGLMARLRARVANEGQAGEEHWAESKRLLDYFEAHDGRFDLKDIQRVDLGNFVKTG